MTKIGEKRKTLANLLNKNSIRHVIKASTIGSLKGPDLDALINIYRNNEFHDRRIDRPELILGRNAPEYKIRMDSYLRQWGLELEQPYLVPWPVLESVANYLDGSNTSQPPLEDGVIEMDMKEMLLVQFERILGNEPYSQESLERGLQWLRPQIPEISATVQLRHFMEQYLANPGKFSQHEMLARCTQSYFDKS